MLEPIEIIVIESASNYLEVYTSIKTYMLYGSMNNMELLLQSDAQFLRISRSYIINTQHIKSTDHYIVNLTNGIIVSVGESFRKKFYRFWQMKYARKTTFIFCGIIGPRSRNPLYLVKSVENASAFLLI